MNTSRGRSLLDAVPTIHVATCDGWRLAGDASLDRSLPDSLAAYVAMAQPVYRELRRLVGHTAGLLILAQASNRRDTLDLPSFVVADEAWLALREQMENLRAPTRLSAHLNQLRSVHGLLGACIAFLKKTRIHDGSLDLADALANLSKAYSHLQSASDPRAGMTMVDFTAACCSCGKSTSKNS